MNRDQIQPIAPDDRTLPSLQPADTSRRNDQQLAAQYIRSQIDSIYDTPERQATSQAPTRTANQTPQNPYQKTHDPNAVFEAQPHQHATNQWQKYHQAWQQYYQQYYQRYYLGQIHAQKQQQAAVTQAPAPVEQESRPPTSPSKQLRDELLGKVKTRAQAARKSHHFVPITAAVVVGVLFLFIQYNQLLFAEVKAYVSPGNADNQSIIVDPTGDIEVGSEPRLIIPKINVDTPVVYGLRSLAESVVQDGLRDGVVHYPIPGASSVPGESGNSVFLGHSSNDVFDSGDYKFVFLMLERLEKGDRFYIHYQGTRYTYVITEKKVIFPNQIQELIVENDKPMATLITCVPIGTALKRLLVYAEQVSPDPNKAAEPAQNDETLDPENIPGDSPTLLERLFGA